jgi:hypothetical protein
MKKVIFILLFVSIKMFGQSVTISPQTIDKQNSNSDDLKVTSYGKPPSIVGFRANGTAQAKTRVLLGNLLMKIEGGGFDGYDFFYGGRINFKATQDWDFNNGAAITFETTPNTSFIPVERMVINHDGKVGIGLTSPNQILDINGRMRIRHTPGFTSGVWMSNSTNGLGDGDGAFFGLLNDTQAGIFIGNSWRFAFNSNGNAVITGFTQLGNSVPAGAAGTASAPAIKTMFLTGTTASTEGASASVATGLLNSKILSYNVLVQNGTSQIQPEHTDEAGHKYHTFLNNGNVYIRNSDTQSEFILSKSFKVLVTYTE